ncbi:MAG: EAL domain-containing protein [Pseudonocardiales bacterium]
MSDRPTPVPPDLLLDLGLFFSGVAVAFLSVTSWILSGTQLAAYDIAVAVLAVVMSRFPLTLTQRSGDVAIGFEAAPLVFLSLTVPPVQALALWSMAMVCAHGIMPRRLRARLFNFGITVTSGALLVWIVALGRNLWPGGPGELITVVLACCAYFGFDLLMTTVSIAVEEKASLNSALNVRSVLIGLICFVGVDTVGYLGALLLRKYSTWTLLLLLMPVAAILVAALAVGRFQLDQQRLGGLLAAARQALDWTDETQAEQSLVDHTGHVLRHSFVELRDEPAGPGEIGAELKVDGHDKRYLVARRKDNVDRFNGNDQRALDAIAAVGAASLNRRRLTEETAYLARHDILTGLVNRSVFSDRLEHGLKKRGGRGRIAVLYCDLDGFKSINDQLGHEGGDQLLVAVAERISGCLRGSDTAARIGGDEFAILVEEVPDPRGPEHLAERILQSFDSAFVIDGREVHMRASIGIAYGDGAGAEDVLRQADTAMYRAKARGKGQSAVFVPSMQSEILERIELEEELRKAVVGHRIELAYQPVVRLFSGEIEGFEALARWNHPTLGPVPPEVFIAIAEQTGLIDQLGEQVLALGHAAAVMMRESSGRALTMGVNVSPAQVKNPALLRQVRGLIASTPDVQLVLELTESALLADDTETASALLALEEAGAALAVDDFGVGYSSIGYLYRLPVKIVKIDRSLIQALGEPRADTLVQGVVAMAQAMGLTVLAEGIEDWDTVHRIRQLGCRLGQGHLLARPMSLDEALAAVTIGSVHSSRLQTEIAASASALAGDAGGYGS